MVQQIIGGMLIIASATGLGMYFAAMLKCEIRDLKDFQRIVIYLKGEIIFSKTSLPYAIRKLSAKNMGVYTIFLNDLSYKLDNMYGLKFQEIWDESVENELKDTCLTRQEKEFVKEFGGCLCNLDKQTQTSLIDGYLYELDNEIKELNTGAKDRIRMFNALGILSGFFIVVILA